MNIEKEPFPDRENVQIVDFYGEAASWPTPDLIHCEPLEKRSKIHNWQIKPHRHKGIVQIFHLQKGAAKAHLDSADLELSPGSFLVVPEMCIHDFIWSPDSQGYVLFIANPFIRQLDHLLGTPNWGASSPGLYQVDHHDKDFIELLFSSILIEYQQQKPSRNLLIESMIRSLSIWLSRQVYSKHKIDRSGNKAHDHYAMFCQLVEEHYRQQPQITWYAQQTGITPSHLNTVCRKVGGKPALEIIHERLLLEAKRNLIYTTKSVAEISDQLGFSEPSYFIRFFKRNTSITPRQFREESYGNISVI